MADKKISALTSAATPLAGTEVLPIVQSGSTVKVPVSNLTAGRTVAMSNATVGSGGSANAATSVVINGTDNAANGSYILGQRNSSNAWLTGDYQSAFGSGSGYVTFVYGAVPTVFYNTAVGEQLRLDGVDVKATLGNFVVGTAGKGITTGSATALGLGVNNTVTAMTINTNGDIGFGTSTISAIFGTTVRIFNASNGGTLQVGGTTVNSYLFTSENLGQSSLGNSSSHPFTFFTNDIERMRIDAAGNVGIGATAAATALLDVQSTTKGVRFPNMTTTQKNAITPSAGTVVFDTTLAKLCVYSGAAWQTITSV